MQQDLEIIFKEYDTLRTEIIALTGHMYNVIGFGAAISAALLAWSTSQGFDFRFWFLVFVFASVVWLLWMMLHVAISRNAERLRQIEAEVNRRAGDKLLQWETHKSPSSAWIVTDIYRRWFSK
jgi:ABC-type transport system involved in Fe-S cluster assembly fused permease/ATPase subunit